MNVLLLGGIFASIFTGAIPLLVISNSFAAPSDISISRPLTNNRSIYSHIDRLPGVSRLVTVAFVPNGNVGWAAVRSFLSNFSPLAVVCPLEPSPVT